MTKWRRVGAALVALGATGVAPTSTAEAQARAVLATTHTTPRLPEPGDDVTVRVDVQGCPSGAAVVELYIETDDGVSRTTELMAREPVRTSMLWTAQATLRLLDAPGGWYGARVVCGTFRPPREPMVGTRFVVGARPTATVRLAATEVAAGGALTVFGTGCLGGAADAQLVPSAEAVEAYTPDVEVAVQTDGAWSITLDVPKGTRPGRVVVRARCLATNQYGRRITLPYANRLIATITP